MKDIDKIISFGFNKASVRGKIVRLEKVSNDIASRFTNTNDVNKVFLESIVASTIFADNFKFDGMFKLQIMPTNSKIKAILCDNNGNGELRAYISLNNDVNDDSPLLQNGHMLFHLDQKIGSPYQAITQITNGSISDSTNEWFKQSAQIPTLIKIYVDSITNKASAIFLQIIPDQYATDEQKEENNRVFEELTMFTETITDKEILNDDLEYLLFKLYNEFDVVVYGKKDLQYKCFCSKEKLNAVLHSIPQEEQEEIRAEHNGNIIVECDFCKEKYYL